MMEERSMLELKDKRLDSLFSALDDRESKLKSQLDNLDEQKEQWMRSAADLFRRESAIEDWQKNHSSREAKLVELNEAQEQRFNGLLERETALTESEQEFKMKELAFQEQQGKSAIQLERMRNTEDTYKHKEEKLHSLEDGLRRREAEIELRERELASKRREMESWDMILKDREK